MRGYVALHPCGAVTLHERPRHSDQLLFEELVHVLGCCCRRGPAVVRLGSTRLVCRAPTDWSFARPNARASAAAGELVRGTACVLAPRGDLRQTYEAWLRAPVPELPRPGRIFFLREGHQ